MKSGKASTIRRRVRIGLLGIWIAVFGYLFANMRAIGVDDAVLASDSRVRVETTDRGLVFTPLPDTQRTALLFFPGALVATKAYAPTARAAAEAGFKAVLVDVPLTSTWLASGRERALDLAEGYINDDPERRWVAGGHSLGGKFALALARRGVALDGLFLVATSHPREDDFTSLAMPVTKVYGSQDGLASEEEIEQFGVNLPAHTQWVRVEGANHAHFAHYGRQLGDRKATIPREAQQAALRDALRAMLAAVEQAD
ncbi:MAG: alpha/beta family hydrolase [Rhodothermales bacterium]